jgi:succinate dehydrogenase/fumarate reductase flavoprotein subunit
MNLELMELATLLPKGFGAGGMNGINSMGGHETDAYGNRFIGKYSPVFMENCNRQIMIKGTYQEQIEGKGPPFYMDMRHLSKEDVDHLQNVLMVGDKATYNDYLEQRGIGFATHPMEVEFSEFAYGGVLVANERLESTIDGLFSGCHFQSLSGAMCGGYSAGAEAAKAALKVKALADINATEAANEKERIFQPMKIHGGLSYKDFEGTIRQVMNYYVGYVRNEKGLEIALKSLKLIESRTNELTAADLHELMRANEAKHLIRHCQLSSQAALIRRESGRTFYWRSDYPDLNEEMEKNIVLWQENGEPKSALVSPSQLYGRS